MLRIKVVERAGEKIVDALHKSNPWEEVICGREDCLFCYGSNEKMIGKCKKRGVVYETLCMLCEKERKREDMKGGGGENEATVELIGKKRNPRSRKRYRIKRKCRFSVKIKPKIVKWSMEN